MNMQMKAATFPKAYAVYNEGTLTFYYDGNYTSQQGTIYRFEIYYNDVATDDLQWSIDHSDDITNAVFDASFADYSPDYLGYLFSGCGNLTTITGLENVNTSNVTSMERMFRQCHALKSLDLRSWDTSSVTDMRQMFHNCNELKNLDLSGWNTSKVTNMRFMFYNCINLKRLDLSSWNTSKVTDMSSMFEFCLDLKYILCGNNWSVAKVTESDGIFYGCVRLEGGAGTRYISSQITNISYAHIDGGPDNPGYLRRPIQIGRDIIINDFEWPTDFEPGDYEASTSTPGCGVSRIRYVQYSKEVTDYTGEAGNNLSIDFFIEAEDGVFSYSPENMTASIGSVKADNVLANWIHEGIIVFSFTYQVPTPEGGKYIRSASASVTEPTVGGSPAKAKNAAPAKAKPINYPYTVTDPLWIEMNNGEFSFVTSFEAGHQYAVALTFTAEEGRQWHPTRSVIYINGQQAELIEVEGTNLGYISILNSGKTGPLYSYQNAQTTMAAYIFPKLTGGIATDIQSMDNGKWTMDNSWYTIDGRKLNGKPAKKGMYIHNGKKAFVNK